VKSCPRCQETLRSESIDGVEIDECPQCAGLWFDEKELNQVARSHQGALVELDDQFVPEKGHRRNGAARGGLCPNCGSALFPFELKHSKGILLGGCRTCKGIWVDDGELRAIWRQVEEQRKRDDQGPAKRRGVFAAASFLTKLSCPVCNETNPASALVCWRCQAVLRGRQGAMLCPQCSGRLLTQDWGELTLDRCQSCGGLWLTDQALSKLLAQGPPPVEPPSSCSIESSRFALLETPGAPAPLPAPPPPPNQKLCPVCQWPLFPYEYAYSSGIQLDRCRSCEGVWVDGGELEGFARFVAENGA